MRHPRLRDSKRLLTLEPYPINEIPQEIIKKVGKRLVYMLCVGRKDLTGDDWGNVFADAIGGTHLQSPIGIADVTFEKMAWSMKTVKTANPHRDEAAIRLISGRCSPDYSYGITDPHDDIQKIGRAVLNIWNERVNIAYDYTIRSAHLYLSVVMTCWPIAFSKKRTIAMLPTHLDGKKTRTAILWVSTLKPANKNSRGNLTVRNLPFIPRFRKMP